MDTDRERKEASPPIRIRFRDDTIHENVKKPTLFCLSDVICHFPAMPGS